MTVSQGLSERFGIGDVDAIFQHARTSETDALVDRHLRRYAVRSLR